MTSRGTYSAAHYKANRESILAQKRVYHAANKGKISDGRRKRKYGLTPEVFESMLERQNGRCAVCLEQGDRSSLCVDHDHATRVIRGLLCSRCNLVLGKIHDNPALLRALIRYLRQWKTRPPILLTK